MPLDELQRSGQLLILADLNPARAIAQIKILMLKRRL